MTTACEVTVTISKVRKQVDIPEHLLRALDSGELTQDELRELITIEAEQLGLSLDEAIEAAHHDVLPKDPLGSDIQYLVKLLAA